MLSFFKRYRFHLVPGIYPRGFNLETKHTFPLYYVFLLYFSVNIFIFKLLPQTSSTIHRVDLDLHVLIVFTMRLAWYETFKRHNHKEKKINTNNKRNLKKNHNAKSSKWSQWRRLQTSVSQWEVAKRFKMFISVHKADCCNFSIRQNQQINAQDLF